MFTNVTYNGLILGVAPGGGLEAQCGTPTYKLLWKKRCGFAKVALEAGVPIIPVFTENCRESVVNFQTGMWFWRAFYDWTRIPITPMYGGFPVSMTTHIGKRSCTCWCRALLSFHF